MLNQSFSQETFQEIFDKENRKGKNIENLFKSDFESSLEHLQLIQAKTKEIKNEPDKEKKKIFYQERKKLKREREELIKSILESASLDLPKKINSLNLVKGPVIGKQTYLLENKIENFFISKKIQWNITRTYKVKQANRYSILNQLTNLLGDKFPKYVVRTDIKSFYETIPQKPLLEKINSDHLLSVLSKRFINKVIEQYNVLTLQTGLENPLGIPRGVGISPYLSELYMRTVDKEIMNISGLTYYARYVDDIIAVFTPESSQTTKNELNKYKSELIKIIKNRGLDINLSKTSDYNLLCGINYIIKHNEELLDDTLTSKNIKINPKTIDYLGYSIGAVKRELKYSSQNKNNKITYALSIDLSEKKILKYRSKIKKAFDEFKRKRKNNEKEAFKLLDTRISYLSSNTKLLNNKSNILIGIFYSNPFINYGYSLNNLDSYLTWHINHASINVEKKKILKQHNFEKGFRKKKFILFPLKKETYKNHNAKNTDAFNKRNEGIIRYGLREINSIWKKF